MFIIRLFTGSIIGMITGLFVGIIVLCLFASSLALLRLRKVEPAMVFRG